MTESQASAGTTTQWAYLMDLLSHDALNNDQAVLGYLELVLADQALAAKNREYAEKAITHVRTSTLLLENARDLMAARGARATSQDVDLIQTVKAAAKELGKFFPKKRFKIRVPKSPTEAKVSGNVLTKDLVFSAFMEMTRVDPGGTIEIDVEIVGSEKDGKPSWTLRLSDRNAVLQPGVSIEDMDAILAQDSSKMVKMSGFLFSMMGSRVLGGAFAAKELGGGKGVQFALSLAKAGES